MKNIVTFVGSGRKKHTYNACKKFLRNLNSYEKINYEIISLFDYNLKPCEGCKTCLDFEEKLCPIKDDFEILINKILDADGVIFASPNYAFQVSAQMKIFLERMAYLLHRPKFFKKTCANIVVEGVYGGKDIIKYLNFTTNGFGFNVIKTKTVLKTIEPISKKQKEKNDKKIKNLSKLYYKKLIDDSYSTPSLIELIVFRITRLKIKRNLNENYKDYRYFKSNKWFTSDYYYPVKLNIFKKIIGKSIELFL